MEDKLVRDLEILEAMAAEMDQYLISDVLFGPMLKGGMPKLTLGGYLMREYRLQALRDQLLDERQQVRLDAAVAQFNQALVEKIVRFEQKAHRELEARLRQWSEFLRDLEQGQRVSASHYGTAVEPRAMIEALIDRLRAHPYQLEAQAPQRLGALDSKLRLHWEPGEFVWPEAWQQAYPKGRFWWLYGLPKKR